MQKGSRKRKATVFDTPRTCAQDGGLLQPACWQARKVFKASQCFRCGFNDFRERDVEEGAAVGGLRAARDGAVEAIVIEKAAEV